MNRPDATECHSFFVHLAKFVQAENLEAARVRENRARPRHETMQAAQLAHLLHPRPQIKMVGISQKDLDAQFFQNVLRNAFDRGHVPTGMNTGVSITPCGVVRRPARAGPEVASI